MIRKMMILVVLGLALCWGIGTNVCAYIEVTGTVAKDPVEVFAEFTPGWNTLTVDVQNATVNPSNVGQNLSDRSFIWSRGRTTGTLTSGGVERRIAGNGTFADDSVVHMGSGLVSFGDGLRLYVLGTPVAPDNTILGLPEGIHGNANARITKNAPHNPFLFGTKADPVTFELNIPGVTPTTTISDVVSPFGTSEGSYLAQVPEPATLLLLGLGLVGVAVVKRKFNK